MAEKLFAKPVLIVIGMMLLLVSTCLMISCDRVSSDGNGESSGIQNTGTPSEVGAIEVGAISLSSKNGNTVIGTNKTLSSTLNSTLNSALNTLKIKVELISGSGQPISGQAIVNFELDDPTLGKINSPLVVTDGTGTVDFVSKDREGIVKILASSGDGSPAGRDVQGSLDIQISDVTPPDQVNISADPNKISIKGTSHIKVMVLDKNDKPVVDGTKVNFSLGNASYGTISESAFTVKGGASAVFTASDISGEIQITASAGSASQNVTVDIASAEAGSIEFVSAVPNIIGLKESGQVETSTVTFLVKNSNGDPVLEAQSVSIELFGPGGGEYIEKEGQNKVTVSTEQGEARVDVHSGVIPGPITLKATIVIAGGTELSTSSGVISIGGGKPAESHFSLSATVLNLEGLAYDGIKSQINVRLADRYGNVEVLEGTTVSFYSEAGGVSRAVAMDKKGEGSVLFRTQQPIPHKTTPTDSEKTFMNRLNATFGMGIDTTDPIDPEDPNPRDGLCTVVVLVDGEEEFTDSNANGKYDPGESFDDTYDDIFIDKDDDKTINTLFEDLVIDRDNDASFDGYSGIWDGNKKIYKTIDLLITGEPFIHTDFVPTPIPNGGSLSFHVFIGDENYNIPIAGTIYSISTDTGKLSGTKSYIFADTSSTAGGPIFSYVLYDDKTDETDPPKIAEVTISLTWKGGGGNLQKSLTCAVSMD